MKPYCTSCYKDGHWAGDCPTRTVTKIPEPTVTKIKTVTKIGSRGRPKIHANNAAKQKAYRKRKQ